MFQEIALEPSLLRDWRDFRFFISQFGATQGRFISRFPSDWRKRVFEAAGELPEMEFQKIQEMMSDIESRLLPRLHAWSPSKDWLPNAVEEHKVRPFHAIVASSNPTNDSSVIRSDEILPGSKNAPTLWNARRSISIKRTVSDMAGCVSLLLRSCRWAVFIDPHFDPGERRFTAPLRAFLKEIASRHAQAASVTKIEYHLSNKNKDVAGFNRNLNQWIKPALNNAAKIKFVRWDSEELHNRYLITDRGGVSFLNGLDVDKSPPSEDVVTILDEETCASLVADYSEESLRLTWLNDTIELS